MIDYVKRYTALVLLSAAVYSPAASGAPGALVNGSFETGKFINTFCNYMQLPTGSKTIKGWKVTTSSGDIVWAKSPTCDGLNAADGTFFLDLTGFGAGAANGAMSQKIRVTANTTYNFSIDLLAANDSNVSVKLGKQGVVLTAGTPFTAGSTTWVPYTGTFKGGARTTVQKLVIKNTTSGGQLAFIDNVVITAQP